MAAHDAEPLQAPGPVAAEVPVLDGPGSVTPSGLLTALEPLLGAGSAASPGSGTPGLGDAAQDERPALVVATSGSTGAPKRTVLSAGALRASGTATAAATSSAGASWLLALPVHYVAGAQVIARSVLAGTEPVVLPSAPGSGTPGFTAADFLAGVEALPAGPRMTSLVPTQVHTLLEAAESGEVPAGELLEALRSFTAILLGGAPASRRLLRRCEELEVPLVLTYGSAETAGGCVYDGVPLPGVEVRIEHDDAGPSDVPLPGDPASGRSGAPAGPTPDVLAPAGTGRPGRIWLGGPTIAHGYLGDPARTAGHFLRDAAGTRWYGTDDLGLLREDGEGRGARLAVSGRADDVVITGGVKVSARAVAAALEEDPGVREALVVGVPDERWGTAVAALLSRAPGAAVNTPALRERVAQRLGRAAAPKTLLVLDALPAASTGKPDRAAAARLLAAEHRRGGTPRAR
ncbi:AMP-binding protein [Rothia halotolerans]|uniref:AMP-binding protein n=1 Tax=Rothia halotolerans TaxID=405770 RepID=UPI00101E095E|nr:AMP-binding protein [Rothia halotolerans]